MLHKGFDFYRFFTQSCRFYRNFAKGHARAYPFNKN